MISRIDIDMCDDYKAFLRSNTFCQRHILIKTLSSAWGTLLFVWRPQGVPGFLESIHHLLRESRPGELASTLDSNCGGQLRRERHVLSHPPSVTTMASLFRLGQVLRGKSGRYIITKQIQETVWFAKYVSRQTGFCG
jgi:hypothetical protein